MRKIIIFICLALLAGFSVYAVDNTKPDSHNAAWERNHGKAAKANEQECLSCHEEKLECIACHEDAAPRSHNAAWVYQGHGLESRWNRSDCAVCHKEDFCSACHETAIPKSHSMSGFADSGSPNFHCKTSCQIGKSSWVHTPSKNCIVCHKTIPVIKSTGELHEH